MANSNFKIKLGVQLDSNAAKTLQSEIDNQKLSIKISNIKLDNNVISSLQKQFDSLKINLNFDNANNQSRILLNNVNQIARATTTIGNLKRMNIVDESLNSRLTEASRKLQEIKANTDALGKAEGIAQLNSDLKLLTTDVKTYNRELEQANSKNFFYDQQKQIANIKRYINENTKAAKDYGEALQNALNNTKNATNTKELTTARKEFQALSAEIKEAGQDGKTFTQSFKDLFGTFSQLFSAAALVQTFFSALRNGFSTIVALDDAMIELKKVTDETAETYANFYTQANSIAKELGSTTEAVINHTAAWAQMGLTMEQAVEAAKTTSIFSTISPEMTDEQAETALISTMKAYGIEAEDMLDGIASKVNIVGNNMAATNTNIAEILRRSSSALAAGNNTLDQNIALGAAAQEIVQDDAKVGNALKTISMNIRSLDEETGSYDETLESIKDTIYGITGVSAFTDSTKQTYKSTYDYLKDISEVWDELSDKQQSTIASELFGKFQASSVCLVM